MSKLTKPATLDVRAAAIWSRWHYFPGGPAVPAWSLCEMWFLAPDVPAQALTGLVAADAPRHCDRCRAEARRLVERWAA